MPRSSQRHKLEVHGSVGPGVPPEPEPLRLLSYTPDPVVAGYTGVVTFTGTGFDSGCEFWFLTPTDVLGAGPNMAVPNSTTIEITDPTKWVEGTRGTYVYNPVTYEYTEVLTVTILPAPPPTLDNYSPDPVIAGVTAVVTVNGTGLDQTDELWLMESFEMLVLGTDYTIPDPTTILITAPSKWVVGDEQLVIYTLSDMSNVLPIVVAPAPATLTSLVPSSIPASSGNTSMNAFGTNFFEGDKVYAGETMLATTYLGDDTVLNCTIPASMLTAEGTLEITVRRSGQSTSSLTFTVTRALIWSDFLVEHIDPTNSQTITGSPVSDISNPDAGGFDVAPRFQQTVSVSSRPTISAGRLTFDGVNDYLDGSAGYDLPVMITLPDSFYSQAGKGPTCTGLFRVSNGSWWMGTYGKKSELTAGSETFHPSLIHYSADFSEVIDEIRLVEDLGMSGVAGIQGVVYQPSSGKIFFADLARYYGLDLFTYTVSPNLPKTAGGLAMNNSMGEMLGWTSASTVTRWNPANGTNIGTFTIRDGNDRDHLFYDPIGGVHYLYTTCRANGSAGRVVKYEYQTMVPVKAWAFEQARAIEGVSVVDNDIYVCSDEYYHNTGDQLNRIKKFAVDIASPNYGEKLTIGWVGNPIVSPQATFKSHFTGGDPSYLRGVAVMYGTVADTLSVAFSFGTPGLLAFTVPAVTTENIYTLEFDAVAHTVKLYVNGTLNESKTDATITGSMPSLVWTLGASYEISAVASRFLNCTLGGFMVMPNTTYRQEMEGALAHRTGNTAKLPAGHPYKTVPPPTAP